MKNTFLRTVGSDNAKFMTIDVRTTEKLTLKAYERVVTTVEKKNDMMINDYVVIKYRKKLISMGVLVKQLKLAQFPIIIISVVMSKFMKKAVMIHEAQYAESRVPRSCIPLLRLSTFSRINSSNTTMNTESGTTIKYMDPYMLIGSMFLKMRSGTYG